jgi:hypothetical protein
MQKDAVVGQVSTKALYLPLAMKNLVEMTFKMFEPGSWDYLVVYEHDMIIPEDGFEKMSHYDPDVHHVVGSAYYKHEAPHHMMAWTQIDPPLFSPMTSAQVRQLHDYPGLYPVDGVAMGFTAISRKVLENWDHQYPMWDAQEPLKGHDLWFCHAAKLQGFNIYLDSAIQCGHLTQQPIGYGDSQAALAADPPARWSDTGARPQWAEGNEVGAR